MASSPATSFTRLSITAAGFFNIARARAMFSYAVSVSSRLKSWKINPSFVRLNFESSFAFMRVMSVPSMNIWPEVTVSIVEMQLSMVVLPLPEAPIMPVNSPAGTSKLTPFTALVTLPFPP